MRDMDVIPLGDGLFIIQLFSVRNIPVQISFKIYYEGECEFNLPDGTCGKQDCVIYRPGNRANGIGTRTTDWLILAVKLAVTGDQLSGAAIRILRFGEEITEWEARHRVGR